MKGLWDRGYAMLVEGTLLVYGAPDDIAPIETIALGDVTALTRTAAYLEEQVIQLDEEDDGDDESDYTDVTDDSSAYSSDTESDTGTGRRPCVMMALPAGSGQRTVVLGSEAVDVVDRWYETLRAAWEELKPKPKKLGVLTVQTDEGDAVEAALPTRHQVVRLRSLPISTGGMFGKGMMVLLKSLDTMSVIVKLEMKRKSNHLFYAHEIMDLDIEPVGGAAKLLLRYKKEDGPVVVLTIAVGDGVAAKEVFTLVSEAMWSSNT